MQGSQVVTFGKGSNEDYTGVGREVKGVMIYSSLERCETFITRHKKPVALFELWMLLETGSNTTVFCFILTYTDGLCVFQSAQIVEPTEPLWSDLNISDISDIISACINGCKDEVKICSFIKHIIWYYVYHSKHLWKIIKTFWWRHDQLKNKLLYCIVVNILKIL